MLLGSVVNIALGIWIWKAIGKTLEREIEFETDTSNRHDDKISQLLNIRRQRMLGCE